MFRERVTDHAAISRIGQQVASGLLPLRVAETFPAAEAVAAHCRFDEGACGDASFSISKICRAWLTNACLPKHPVAVPSGQPRAMKRPKTCTIEADDVGRKAQSEMNG